jgi:tRNA U34 5-methylaminomethyl-2-thiouridine-forming methyltransferase MnmC
MGFGTGLNALLTLIEAEKQNRNIYYVSVDLFPLDTEQIASLNFCKQLQRPDLQSVFEEMHNSEWEKEIPITSHFLIKKLKADLMQVEIPGMFQLIYFDAFDPVAQPELWTNKIFEKIFSVLQPGGILVTYSSKGDVRRAIQAAGFRVEKLPGPKGKRQIVRAVRPL